MGGSGMKKTATLICILLYMANTYGQQPVEYILRAKAFTEEGKPDQAIELLNQALSGNRDSRLYLERAETYILKGDYSDAASDFNEANIINPASGDYGLSRLYALRGDVSTALYHLELNLNSAYKKSEKVIMLDPAFGAIDNRPEWRQFWKKDWYSDKEKRLSEIEYYASAGKIDESRVILAELKTNYNGDNEVLYADALIAYSLKNFTRAVKVLIGLTGSNPDNEKYLRLLAKSQTESSNMAGASNTYTKLIDLGIADPKLFILRADCYRKTGENERALSDVMKYLDIYPADKVALSLAGKLAGTSGDNLKALSYFSTNLKLHPNDPQCYIDRADTYFGIKSWEWAINDYSMSLDLQPENSTAWLNKGIALLNTGRTEDACHDFRKSFSLGNKKATEYISRNCIK
jgi:Flp pilus assembly protein TadD